ncbi:MAG: hypothetical protein JRE58_02395 [Deltaproteobacteria bacterium]|nr:hypothetical protein [Deltaproteobacteria bacterium]
MKKSIITALILALALCASAVWAECVWVCDNDTTAITVQKDKDGRRSVWTEVIRDDQDKLISRRVDTYSYKQNGDVHVINQQVFGADNKIKTKKDITHYPDKQPTVDVVQAVAGAL